MTTKPFINDMTCKYDGRVLKLDVYVNSNEDLNEVVARVSKAARGQVRNAVLTMASEYTGEDGKQLWAALQKVSADMGKNPKAVPVDEDLKPL